MATLAEIEAVFAFNPHRRALFAGLVAAATNLANAGCPYLYLDGSYVTGKPVPGDYDACWEPSGVDPALLDPVFMDFSNKRQRQKNKYKGEFFPFGMQAAPGVSFINFFQTDRFTGLPKGIILINLKQESFVIGGGGQP